ncbi:MAG: site-specific DNA-methyltransferase [Aestuariivita sp.]|nr:site-specific DNA-methyltransferase [Aestuariivita sp.]
MDRFRETRILAKTPKTVEALTHSRSKRRNIPTAEHQPFMEDGDQSPIQVAYKLRDPDLDPQLVWRGKDIADWFDLVVPAPPLFIQEKVHPKVLVDDLLRMSALARADADKLSDSFTADLFADFNGLPDENAKTEFYQHDANWCNRMILGDSFQVMASLAEREGLRGKVQCIYFDPPYGIKFNSNFQWSTASADVRDRAQDITREPEQVKAFRDTWSDGIHSYLAYLRDRLTVARDLLTPSGSIFVQIGADNVHRVRVLLDEVFGSENHIVDIIALKTSSQTAKHLASIADTVLLYARDKEQVKYRQLQKLKKPGEKATTQYKWQQSPDLRDSRIPAGKEPKGRIFGTGDLTSQSGGETTRFTFEFLGNSYSTRVRAWMTNLSGMNRLKKANRILPTGSTIRFRRFLDDFLAYPITNVWDDVFMTNFSEDKIYVVQSSTKLVQRCILMSTDPGDLVLDPTCGSGTTAYAAEKWGRRWITVDTSRVALALARSRIMGARYPFYLLADSREGKRKEAELTGKILPDVPTYGDIRQGFVYERVPHITLRSIANNSEIDVIYDQYQPAVQTALDKLNAAMRDHIEPFTVESGGRKGQEIDFTAPRVRSIVLPSGEQASASEFLEWEVPHESNPGWNEVARSAHDEFWEARKTLQSHINKCIASSADSEFLFDQPFVDNKKVRVAGPFSVESLSPHRLAPVDKNGEFKVKPPETVLNAGEETIRRDFAHIILENLRTSGVQQSQKNDRITFDYIDPCPGALICAEGKWREVGKNGKEHQSGIFIGPEFGTVSRPNLVSAAKEASDFGFDSVLACAFNYDARASELSKLGNIPILKARMNADLHMATDLKNTQNANLFVIFGEPDIEIQTVPGPQGESDWLQLQIKGVDVFDPKKGEVRSDETDGIACWFVDTDYDSESFFVRHAYFLGAGDPYKSLRSALNSEIDASAWDSLNRDTSRPFPKPSTGQIAVKVINHLGDEVMKVFRT